MSESASLSDFFGDVISCYSRAEAIADGVLVSISPVILKDAGIVLPVAVTDTVWNYQPVGTMSFNATLIYLNPNSSYQVCCFVNDVTGYKYGDTTTFITAHLLPSPKIPYVYFVNHNSAIIKTNVTPGTISNFYYWLRYKDVDSANWNYSYHVSCQNMDSLYNLVTNHSFMLQLVLVCGNDTIYSPIQHFVTTKTTPCPGLQTYTDPRDGNVYNTVFIKQ